MTAIARFDRGALIALLEDLITTVRSSEVESEVAFEVRRRLEPVLELDTTHWFAGSFSSRIAYATAALVHAWRAADLINSECVERAIAQLVRTNIFGEEPGYSLFCRLINEVNGNERMLGFRVGMVVGDERLYARKEEPR